ncbi:MULTISPECIES: hypothetical protein [unclassified Thalassospira]|nr:hypothetical protein [Thalassospira sp.]MBO6772010.1 hypothetical protein [Thalassospira sp.]
MKVMHDPVILFSVEDRIAARLGGDQMRLLTRYVRGTVDQIARPDGEMV